VSINDFGRRTNEYPHGQDRAFFDQNALDDRIRGLI
jgi:hypothetical protein